jgi:hypothetical protein
VLSVQSLDGVVLEQVKFEVRGIRNTTHAF